MEVSDSVYTTSIIRIHRISFLCACRLGGNDLGDTKTSEILAKLFFLAKEETKTQSQAKRIATGAIAGDY